MCITQSLNVYTKVVHAAFADIKTTVLLWANKLSLGNNNNKNKQVDALEGNYNCPLMKVLRGSEDYLPEFSLSWPHSPGETHVGSDASEKTDRSYTRHWA